MFHQVPDKESNNNIKTASSKVRRRRKKKASANQKNARKDIKIKKQKFLLTMSTWAENYAFAATWQLKHQIAYWKAKAQALECENKILHDIIRQSHFNDDAKSVESDNSAHSEVENQEDGSDDDVENSEHNQEDHDFEVSEEFIQFLAANAKYKEDAKKERERLRAKFDEETISQPPPEPKESTEDRQAKSKDLYGNYWQRICALEIALQSQFIHDVDKDKPMYWPNIPLNL